MYERDVRPKLKKTPPEETPEESPEKIDWAPTEAALVDFSEKFGEHIYLPCLALIISVF